MKYLIFFSLSCFFVFSCQTREPEQREENTKADYLFTQVDAQSSGISFKNTIKQDPLFNILSYEYMFNGGGVAVGDVNNDGKPDIFLTGNQVGNELYLNEGNLNFRNITEEAGVSELKINAEQPSWCTGAVMADVNDDGNTDIYVCRSGMKNYHTTPENLLYINNADGTFTERAKEFGLNDAANSTHATFFDYDKDGDLDAFVLNHFSYFNRRMSVLEVQKYLDQNPQILNGNSSHLYENRNGKFVDVTKEKGMIGYGYGLGVVANDLNNDGWTDLYVSQDYTQPNIAWINDKKGGFYDGTKELFKHIAYFSMGCDVNDFNNDGKPDVIAVDMAARDHVLSKTFMASMSPDNFKFMTEQQGWIPQYMFNELQLNMGDNKYSEIGQMANISKTEWSWAPLFADFDNDGYKDLVITNGYKQNSLDNDFRIALQERKIELQGAAIPESERMEWLAKIPVYKSQNYYFRNNGALEFEDMSTGWLASNPGISNGAAYADLDADGDLDLVLNNIDDYANVLENTTSGKNYLQFDFLSSKGNTTDVLNTKVKLFVGNEILSQEFTMSRGFQSSVEPMLHFGLGSTEVVDNILVEWPNGKVTEMEDIPANQRISLNAAEALDKKLEPKQSPKLFQEIAAELGVKHTFKDYRFDDFDQEILLPHKMSTLGTDISVADVNGDGLDDFFVGGNFGSSGKVFVQNSAGKFILKWATDGVNSDAGSVFFDVDKDGDKDLYVVSGGAGEVVTNMELLQDRLYINNGTGNFTQSTNLPEITSSGHKVVALDFDQDGDLDLVVGGRLVPGKYPSPPKTYLLENDNGVLKDVSEELAPELSYSGMITDILVHDFNQDGKDDLVVCGEWMSILYFENTGSGFSDVSSQYLNEPIVGWWQSLALVDVDADGSPEIIAGNIGKNNKFHPSKEKPLKIFYNDFDGTGTGDIVLSVNYKGKDVPVRGRECSSQQMPMIKEKYPTYNSFANADIEQILGVDKISSSVQYQATEFGHIIINQGKIDYLPPVTQIAPLRTMVILDANRSGLAKIVGAGNWKDSEVETTAYDAGVGFVLAPISGGYEVLDQTGFVVPGEVRDMEIINLARGEKAVVVSNFGTKVQIFKVL